MKLIEEKLPREKREPHNAHYSLTNTRHIACTFCLARILNTHTSTGCTFPLKNKWTEPCLGRPQVHDSPQRSPTNPRNNLPWSGININTALPDYSQALHWSLTGTALKTPWSCKIRGFETHHDQYADMRHMFRCPHTDAGLYIIRLILLVFVQVYYILSLLIYSILHILILILYVHNQIYQNMW